MKRKIFWVPVMAAVLVFCGGCSKTVALTEQEAHTIALYSAHIVSKYNRVETPGLGIPDQEENVAQEDGGDADDMSARDEEKSSDTSEENGGNAENGSGDANKPEDTEEPEDTEREDADNKNTDSKPEEEQVSYVSLSDAVGISGLTVEYTGYEMTDNVSESTYFSLDATDGKKFVVLSLQLENTSADTVPVDILSTEPRFHISINDSARATAQVTLLMDDFNTVEKSFAPGESMKARLVFEVDAELEEDISSLIMDAAINGQNSKIKLL
ncbi:MAG: DUF4352 domain-containing protein [Eubacterium sp.]|nr:DUF4352 domain-containing protein [Eubacterium sp.]